MCRWAGVGVMCSVGVPMYLLHMCGWHLGLSTRMAKKIKSSLFFFDELIYVAALAWVEVSVLPNVGEHRRTAG